MKKLGFFLLALMLVSSQAFAYTITKELTERLTDAETGDSYVRVTGYFALDTSHPAEGETLLPTQLGMASISRIEIGPGAPGTNTWTPCGSGSNCRSVRRFGFDRVNSRFFVITTRQQGSGAGNFATVSVGVDISGEVTYDLEYLSRVPFQAIGPIS